MNIELPKGVVYADTGNYEDDLIEIMQTTCKTKEEFYNDLKALDNIIDLKSYELFIYQDYDNLFIIRKEDLK